MLLITGTIRLPANRLPEAHATMRGMIEASREEDGCLEYAYSQDILEPTLIRVIEAWSNRDALNAHFASDHIAQWRATWPELGISDRNLALHIVSGSEQV